ncbi:MAG TPA: rhomboid family intramembrane serine protease [Gemmatimonadaceae bacterium]|nr:rhomboid family intramembrane serine protease [Gemmatimonadaceae bacterium]
MSDTLYDPPSQPRMTPAVQWLIAANVGVYFLQLTLFGPQPVFSIFGLDPARFPSEWWALATYMFVHAGLWHLVFNMLSLWMFGPRIESVWGARGFTYFYLWCGVGGAVAHLLFSGNAGLVGASAAVMGVLLAYALRWPDEEVYLFAVIPMKTRWLVVWLALINLAMGISSTSGGSGIGWFAHLGGLAFGWIYLRASAFGGLDNFRRWVSPVPEEPEDGLRAVPRSRPRRARTDRSEGIDDVVAKSNAVAARPARSATIPRISPDSTRQAAERLDLVLDKISKHGIESLTTEEVRLLEDMSRKLRTDKTQQQ